MKVATTMSAKPSAANASACTTQPPRKPSCTLPTSPRTSPSIPDDPWRPPPSLPGAPFGGHPSQAQARTFHLGPEVGKEGLRPSTPPRPLHPDSFESSSRIRTAGSSAPVTTSSLHSHHCLISHPKVSPILRTVCNLSSDRTQDIEANPEGSNFAVCTRRQPVLAVRRFCPTELIRSGARPAGTK